MIWNRMTARRVLTVLAWTVLPASVMLPVWVPSIRAAYIDFAQGGILLWLAILAGLTLGVHLSSRSSRSLTACLLLSLLLHMLLVLFLGSVNFTTQNVSESTTEQRLEISFGMPSVLENAARETVRDQAVDLKTTDTRSFADRAKPRPPADVQVKKPAITPQPLGQTESPKSLVQPESASRPDLHVDARIEPQANHGADASAPDVAKIKPTERDPVKEPAPQAPRLLDVPRTQAGPAAADLKGVTPQPVAPVAVHDPIRDSMTPKRIAEAQQRVDEALRQAELRGDRPDRIKMEASQTASESRTEERPIPDPTRSLTAAKQAASGEPTASARPERVANLSVNTARAASLAEAETRMESDRQRQTPGLKSTLQDKQRRVDEPIRLNSAAVSVEVTQLGAQSSTGPTGEIQGPGRTRTSRPEAAAGDVARPVAQTDLTVASVDRGSLVADRPQPVRTSLSAASVEEGSSVALTASTGSPIQPLRGVAASAEWTPTSEYLAEKPAQTAGLPERTFEAKIDRGDFPAPEAGTRVRQAKMVFTGKGSDGGGGAQETLASRDVAGMAGGSGLVVDGAPAIHQKASSQAGSGRPALSDAVGARTASAIGSDARAADALETGGGQSGRGRIEVARSEGSRTVTGETGVPSLAPPGRGEAPQGLAGSLATSAAAPLTADLGEGALSGVALQVDSRGARRAADLSSARIAPGTVRAESALTGDSTSGNGLATRRGDPATGSWAGDRAQAGESPAPAQWTGSGVQMIAGASAQKGGNTTLVAAPNGVSDGGAAMNGMEPGIRSPGTVKPGKGEVVALSFEAQPVADSNSGVPGSAEKSTASGGIPRDWGVAKVAGESGRGDGSTQYSRPSMAAPQAAEPEARRPSRLMNWLSGMTGESKVEVPDTLPRGDRLAAYRTVSAAEMKSSPKMRRQKLIYSLRSPEKRQEHIVELGGSAETEKAVERALAWLAQAQSDDGRWSVARFKGVEVCGGAGDRSDSDSAVTGLALLAYLGAGYTHVRGDYQETIRKGLTWLIAGQTSAGDLRRGGSLYAQAMATAALCEGYSLSEDPWLKEPARKAVQYICDSQNLGAGWRYEPRSDNDTSVTGWMVLALKSGELAGFTVNPQHFRWTALWLEKVRRGKTGGLYAYQEGSGPTPVMTAEGWFCQLFMGEQVRMRGEAESAKYLMENLPVWDTKNRGQIFFYYWYYATLALHLSGGEAFETWNRALREALLTGQRQDGRAAGSWDPADQLGERGGRLYSTTMATLCLEVYYRYLPFYRDAPGLISDAAAP